MHIESNSMAVFFDVIQLYKHDTNP